MTIKDFFEIYNNYCSLSADFMIHPTSAGSDRGYCEFGIYKDDGKFIIDKTVERNSVPRKKEFANEAMAIYYFLEWNRKSLIKHGFPNYQYIYYGDVIVGVVILLNNIYTAYFADNCRIVYKGSSLELQTIDNEFWNSLSQENKNIIDDWCNKWY